MILKFPLQCRQVNKMLQIALLSFAPGQVRRRRSDNFPPSLTDGAIVTHRPAHTPARRHRYRSLSRLRPLTSRAHNNRHRIDRYRWRSEPLQALNRRLKLSCPTQRTSLLHCMDLDARAIPPRTRRRRRLRRPRRRRLLPHPHPHPYHPRTNRPFFRTLQICGALHVRLSQEML